MYLSYIFDKWKAKLDLDPFFSFVCFYFIEYIYGVYNVMLLDYEITTISSAIHFFHLLILHG